MELISDWVLTVRTIHIQICTKTTTRAQARAIHQDLYKGHQGAGSGSGSGSTASWVHGSWCQSGSQSFEVRNGEYGSNLGRKINQNFRCSRYGSHMGNKITNTSIFRSVQQCWNFANMFASICLESIYPNMVTTHWNIHKSSFSSS